MKNRRTSKRVKIVIGIVSIILLLIAVSYSMNTVIGKSITIGNKSKNLSNGGDYITKFVDAMEKRDFYVVKWSEINDKYYTSTGTYESNTASKRRVVCMNEGKSDWWDEYLKSNRQHAMRPVAIIDIEGGLVKVQGTIQKDGYSGNWSHVGQYAAQLAYAAYEEGNASTSNAETYINYRDGWKNFIQHSSSIIDLNKEQSLKTYPSKLNGTAYYDLSSNSNKYLNIITTGSGVGTAESSNITKTVGSYTVNGETYKTKVGPYTLSHVQSDASKEVTLTTKAGNTYSGIIKANSAGKYNLYFKREINGTIDKIEFTQSYQSYRARILVFVTNFSQNRAIMAGDEDYKVEYKVNLKIPKQETDVSLQKYITKVTGVNGNTTYDNATERKNKYAETGNLNIDLINKNKVHQGKNISKNNNVSGVNNYKYSKPVEIEAGDTVEYTITVYNNSSKPAEIEIRDRIIKGAKITEIKSANSNIRWKEFKNSATDDSNYTYYQILVNGNEKFTLVGGGERTFKVYVKYDNYTQNIIPNKAWIADTNPENKQEYRTIDADYVTMKPYEVSLQKIVYSVNGNTSEITSFDRWTSWESNENKANKNANTYKKHNNPVTVANGDYVTYAIRVKNDGETKVNSLTIADTLPSGLSKYKIGTYSSNEADYKAIPNNRVIEYTINRALNSNESFTFYITAKVSESNLSTRVLANNAVIKNDNIVNKNGITVKDTTPNNNQDADYIQLKDIIIAGTVWNDKALDKKQDNYNGVYDEGQENKLEGIKVKLLRTNRNGQGYTVIADTKTDSNGDYRFDASMIYNSIHECERHIKASYQCSNSYTTAEHQANYWKENDYYSYVVQFTYDGITYTSTVLGSLDAEDYIINSNASENEYSRKYFNDQFAKINKDSGINYTTKNEDGYIPQSNHIYDENKMAMNSNAYVYIAKLTEDQLQHVNLGLRGRDVFDLELTSDVYSTKVSVNGQGGTYNYNSNKVTVRKSDINVAEDAANFASETREGSISQVEQTIRTTDLDVNKTVNETTTEKYAQTGLGIEVTYKITVTNTSQTDGTATKIIDYYDSRYTFERAYAGDETLNVENGESGNGFNSIVITTPGSNLTQSNTMDIYVVYTLKTPTITLASLLNGTDRIPTYNMAEIYEYTTKCAEGQTEFTRGLIDKDSAPGSVNQEQARLTLTENQATATKNGKPTTVDYYFGGNDLSKLKYEDDTYATPTLYFTSSDARRTLSGVVFRDNTTTNSETKIKTGNGIKDEGEVGVYGATVKLKEGNKVRYTVDTKEDGTYTFTDFLPGNYTIEYSYGDTTKTVLLNQSGDVNQYSYNGEDYQSTNNTGVNGARKLNDTPEFWYVFNETEAVSTGTDDPDRRKEVSTNVTDFTDAEMTVLNNIRAGIEVSEEQVNNIIDKAQMVAKTDSFTLSVEKTVKDGDNIKQNSTFSESYDVSNMNFGLAEVPVTTIDLQKHVVGFTIKDSAGDNTIASLRKEGDEWKTTGDVLPLEGSIFDVSMEDTLLQGAKLEVTYAITSKIDIEKNFDGKTGTKATITGLVDYIDNDLSYNETLGENNKYWDKTDYEATLNSFREASFKNSKGDIIDRTGGYIDLDGNKQDGSKHASIIKAKDDNPILNPEGGEALITLEKELSATESTVGDIITSNINTYEYDNHIEITGIKYENTETEQTDNFIFRDRVRTPETGDPTTSRMIILAGAQHDTATSELITIHPPTGDSGIGINYYIIAIISLGVLATGIVLIKKYAIKK